jgi:hypothetical protein
VSSTPPLRPVPISAARPPASPPRHETILPEEERDALDALDAAIAAADAGSLREVAGRWPGFLDGWARLGRHALAGGDAVTAYACARTGYHRGLDRLRASGWGGVGMVRWARPTNRGFLRSLQLLLVTSARLGDEAEAERCRRFLLELDPEDGIGAGAYPSPPGRDAETTPG